MNELPKIALGAWAWGNDGTFGNALGEKELKEANHGKSISSIFQCKRSNR